MNGSTTDDLGKWKEFWKDKDSPLHRHNDDFFYKLYADELNLIFRRFEYNGGRVLESGCGNGGLFPFLEVNRDNYIGMDISTKLLKEFQIRFPEVQLIEDSAENLPAGKYALIFSNGVGQYFNRERMQTYINRATSVLEDGGTLVIANLLWLSARNNFRRGFYSDIATPPAQGRLEPIRRIIRQVRYLLQPPEKSMGYWINPEDILRLSPTTNNTILGSIFHPYRFTFVARIRH